ncbi:hypothetical protein MHBO_004038 [Bonamia ostreae]|uniref:Uncharacterized protein n=1 Tax=Bonamia ostreae TaxID=126728 RepID=A0ABV2AS72_9EUKA
MFGIQQVLFLLPYITINVIFCRELILCQNWGHNQLIRNSRQQQRIESLFKGDAPDKGEYQMPKSKSSYIIVDNIDITRSPFQMSVDRKRQIWYCVLLVALEKQAVEPTHNDIHPIAGISQVNNSVFIPTLEKSVVLNNNFIHHIMHAQVLAKYEDSLIKYKSCIPQCINHPNLNATLSLLISWTRVKISLRK